MKTLWPWVLALLVGVGVGLGIHSEQAWRKERDAWKAQVQATEKVNRNLQIQVDAFLTEVRKIDTVTVRLKAKALTIPVPDTCKTVVAIRDSIIRNDSLQVVDFARALQLQKEATQNLQIVVDSAKNVIHNVPLHRFNWKPEIRPGAALIYAEDRKIHAGVGVTLTWKVPL